jgi:formylglycine-generating enzyme required for sulfatase activity
MVSIDGGLFVRNVNRGGKDVDEPKYEPAYSIDRTEVTRGAFAMFQLMQELTGLRAASLPEHLKEKSLVDTEFFPISGLNYATARSYCRYLGKDLPTTAQWQKAFRGGLIIDGQDNPSPKRLFPWHTSASSRPTNIGFAERHESAPARVGSYPEDVSPYGVLDLSGNVSEWSREKADTDQFLSRIHGGDWTTPPKEGFEKITRINTRPEEAIDFAIGVRCVAMAP